MNVTQPRQRPQWTVGQLRAELVGLPDDTPLAVDICLDAHGHSRRRVPLIGAGYGCGLRRSMAGFVRGSVATTVGAA
ncbi:DUF6225 family protein [Cellulomonas carbonis]|uniref:DUF6225 family protein n=1 Tax=Cellulomonas carbonis TaxID=1386092 RepID=UPI003F68B4EA